MDVVELVPDGITPLSEDSAHAHTHTHAHTPSSVASQLAALDALCELVQQEAAQPLIVFIRDLEKLLAPEPFPTAAAAAAAATAASRHMSGEATHARLLQLRRLFDKLSVTRTVVIGAVSAADTRGRAQDRTSTAGGAASALFSKASASSVSASGASGASASQHASPLFDLSIIDHFSRIEERMKESSKVAKLLNKLFPTRVVLVPPTDPTELSRWRRQIEHDVEGMKFEANAQNLRRLLQRNHLEVSRSFVNVRAWYCVIHYVEREKRRTRALGANDFGVAGGEVKWNSNSSFLKFTCSCTCVFLYYCVMVICVFFILLCADDICIFLSVGGRRRRAA